ncbi:MAG: hypothetical protein ACWGNK_11100, partial [Desulfobacterales bacterium]
MERQTSASFIRTSTSEFTFAWPAVIFFTPDLKVKSVDAEPIEDDDDHLRKNRFIPLGSTVDFR